MVISVFQRRRLRKKDLGDLNTKLASEQEHRLFSVFLLLRLQIMPLVLLMQKPSVFSYVWFLFLKLGIVIWALCIFRVPTSSLCT